MLVSFLLFVYLRDLFMTNKISGNTSYYKAFYWIKLEILFNFDYFNPPKKNSYLVSLKLVFKLKGKRNI
ncbi:unnamed protein product [Rhizophagus irregularis]|nr:unnamed protein product [Rhizophagus irregularis]